jgi:hypothetical protein
MIEEKIIMNNKFNESSNLNKISKYFLIQSFLIRPLLKFSVNKRIERIKNEMHNKKRVILITCFLHMSYSLCFITERVHRFIDWLNFLPLF